MGGLLLLGIAVAVGWSWRGWWDERKDLKRLPFTYHRSDGATIRTNSLEGLDRTVGWLDEVFPPNDQPDTEPT